MQVGSWQRSDHRFRLACEIVRQGRIGKLKKVTVVLGKNKTGGQMTYDDGVEMHVLDHGRNGVMFEGETGRVFVNRGTVSGKPVEQLADNPLPREKFNIYAHDNLDRPARMGKLDAIVNHMCNFFDCLRSRKTPVSDVVSQHRSVSTAHLANIAMKLGRVLK